MPQKAADDGERCEDEQRQAHPPARFVRVVRRARTAVAEEGDEEQPRHVERRHESRDGREDVERRRDFRRREKDLVLREEARERRQTRDRENADRHHGERPRHLLPKPAHAEDVRLVGERVHDGARREEQERLEEGVRHEMEHRGRQRADAEREHHVAELADRRIGEDSLDLALRQGDARGEDRRKTSDPGDQIHEEGRRREDEVGARDEVDARDDHRRRMNERGDGRRAFHRVGQPDVQRELARFSNRPDEEEEARDGQEYRAERQDLKRHEHAQVQKVERAEVNLQEQDAEEQAEVADARRDERLLRSLPRRYALIVEADQKVRAESDALPEDVELQEVRREHEAEHRRDEERDEREEAAHAGIVLHVADRVNRDAKRYRRDDEEHHRRDGIDEDAHLQDETADRHPDGLRNVRRFYRDRRP